MYGPIVPVCEQLHADKYRLPNESFEEAQALMEISLEGCSVG